MEKYVALYNQINKLLKVLKTKKVDNRLKENYLKESIKKSQVEIDDINMQIESLRETYEKLRKFNNLMKLIFLKKFIVNMIATVVVLLLIFAYCVIRDEAAIFWGISELWDYICGGLLGLASVRTIFTTWKETRNLRKIYKENDCAEILDKVAELKEQKKSLRKDLQIDRQMLKTQEELNPKLDLDIVKIEEYASYVLSKINEPCRNAIEKDLAYLKDNKVEDILKLVRDREYMWK